jgi:hypothetical protein
VRAPQSLLVPLVLTVLALGLLPASALAHSGQNAPVATSFKAKLAHVPPRIEAKVVDGDQQLWLRVDPRVTVLVSGLRGEEYLRFAPDGVWVNKHSPSAYLNSPRPLSVPKDAVPGAPPDWHRVTSGHTYMWHEDRLHSLAVTRRGSGRSFVGTWTVPLSVNGRRQQISGGLFYAPDPSWLWFWPLIVAVVCCAALLRVRSPRLDRAMAAVVSVATLAAIVLARAGRAFYGRPNVSAVQLVEFGLYVCLALIGVGLLLRPKWRDGAPAMGAVVGLSVALAMFTVLTRGFVLSALPATVERVAVSATMAGAVSSFLVLIFGVTERRGARPRRAAPTSSSGANPGSSPRTPPRAAA